MRNPREPGILLRMEKRVVITGMGTINPLGDSLEQYYQNLIAGKSGIKRWESLDMTGVECKVGGDLGDYDSSASLASFESEMGPDWYKRTRKLFRSATFSNKTAVLTALMAYRDARTPRAYRRSLADQCYRRRAQSQFELHLPQQSCVYATIRIWSTPSRG